MIKVFHLYIIVAAVQFTSLKVSAGNQNVVFNSGCINNSISTLYTGCFCDYSSYHIFDSNGNNNLNETGCVNSKSDIKFHVLRTIDINANKIWYQNRFMFFGSGVSPPVTSINYYS